MCYTPITKKDGSVVPCSKCPKCIARRVSAWSFRLMQEQKRSSSAYFITLTYATEYLPISDTGFSTLSKRDVQLFIKRLRKAHTTRSSRLRRVQSSGSNVHVNAKTAKIKYYLAGEYGDRFGRPHYHMLLFNAKLELIQDAWAMGSIHYGEVTGASVGYTLKYMCKTGRKLPKYKEQQKEFALMSKRLGDNYLTRQMISWHKADLTERMYCNREGGHKISMPRYYKDKIYNQAEKSRIANVFSSKIAYQEYFEMEEALETGIEIWLHNKKEKLKAEYKKLNLKILNNAKI